MDKVDILYTHLINKEPFCFIKLNDGECMAMDNIEASLSRGGEKSSELMAQKLKNALNYEDKNYYIGLPCSKCQTATYHIAHKYLLNNNYPNILNANILINSNINKTFDILTHYLKDREVVVIANDKMIHNIQNLSKININVSHTIIVSDQYAFQNDYDRIKDEWKQFHNNSVIITLCGPLGRVLCHEWFAQNNTFTCLELGSFFDPLLNDRSYLYHTGNHHYCSECFPSSDTKDCDIMKYASGAINKECYYFFDIQSSMCYYNHNINKVIKNFQIRYEKEPYNTSIQNMLEELYTKLLDDNNDITIHKESILKIINNETYQDYLIFKENNVKSTIRPDQYNEYKNNNRSQLYQLCNNFYHERKLVELNIVSQLYLDYFEFLNDNDVRKVKFFNGCANFFSNPKLAIRQFEDLYNDKDLIEGEVFFVKCNLDLLYPKNNNPIPKLVHLIYFKERDFELYHYICILNMIHHMSEYKFILYNDVEPEGNKYWDLLKENSSIEIKHYPRPTTFDGLSVHHVQYAADITRLELLYEHGGIYMDLDMLILKNFDSLLTKNNNDLYISYEGGNDGPLINSILISKPKNEFIKIWLDSFKTGLRMETWAYHIGRQNKYILDKNKHYFIKYKIELLDSKYFLNYSWPERHKFEHIENHITDEMYGIHLFDTIHHNILKNNQYIINCWNSIQLGDNSITKFLNSKGFYSFEGYSQQVPEQVDDLIQLTKTDTNIQNLRVMEIGFNAGHSAEVFLRNNDKLTLTSLDLGGHDYVTTAKEYIDTMYPNRHKLILGDSKKTLPQFISENTDTKFDIIFIDGGHDYETAKADLYYSALLAHEDTIVIVDDTIFTPGWEAGWTLGPTQTWKEYIEQNKINEISKKDYCYGRGMVWGKYNMTNANK